MATSRVSLTSLLLACLLVLPAAAQELKEGDKAPRFEVAGEGAKPISLADFKGQKLVLTFNRANWCPFCMRQIEDLQQSYDEIKKHGAEVLVIFREEATGVEGIKKIRQTTKAEMPMAVDLNAEKTKQYSPEGFDAYIIDEEGKIKKILKGTKPDRPLGAEILGALR